MTEALPTSSPIHSPGPVTEPERIPALDVARGLALLGIFMVNIHFFCAPLAYALTPAPPTGEGAASVILWWITKVFFEGKFYPLFSTLFGMGLVLQFQRARAAGLGGRGGRSFAGMYLRRLATLMVIGILHVVLLWYGDILIVYSIAGLVLLACSRLSARWLLSLAGLWLAIGMLLSTAMALGTAAGRTGPGAAEPPAAIAPEGPPSPAMTTTDANTDAALKPADDQPPADAAPTPADDQAPADADAMPADDQAPADANAMPADDQAPADAEASDTPAPSARTGRSFRFTPVGRLLSGLDTLQDGPSDPLWIRAEVTAYRDGPWSHGVIMRGLSWFGMVIVFVFGFGWHILAMFFIGAALMKLRFFDADRAAWHQRLAGVILPIGLVISAATVVLAILLGAWPMANAVTSPLTMIAGGLVALGYLGATTMLVNGDWLGRAGDGLASAGRMALTIYLGESVISAFVMYSWGLEAFGTFSWPERTIFVLGVYATLVLAASVWMKVFRMGPVEWVWRTATYLRIPSPLRAPLRAASSSDRQDRP